jgi:iron complex transport system permease protein
LAVLDVLTHRLFGTTPDTTLSTVLFNIRLPRVVAAGLVGAALAAAGAAYQSLFRNPLVSPDILGVSTGAGLGAVIGILLGLPVFMIQLFGFAGGLATVMIVVTLARTLRGSGDVLVLVLAGIVVGALAGAAISLVKVLADPYDQLPAITFWLLGSLAGVKANDVAATIPVVLIGLAPLVLFRWRIGVLSLGDDEARALGVNVERVRAIVIAAATLVTASVVAISGVIGWVGLMIPHMARILVGPRFDRLLLASIPLGASFMIAVDTLARSGARIEIPLGVLTAAIGGPLFVWLLARSRKRLAP